MRAIVSWSGGKDSCLACYKALGMGHTVTHLVNFVSQESKRVSFHGTRAFLVRRQAQAIGIPLAQRQVPADLSFYEERFKRAVLSLRRQGAEAMVFGDIYTQEHRAWIERVCGEAGVTPVIPLWGMASEQVMGEFIETGFEAVVIAARADIFTPEWLGRRIDHEFLADVKRLAQVKAVDVCGERGEYHTFVVDGPLFKKRLRVTCGEKVERNGYLFLDILTARLVPQDGN